MPRPGRIVLALAASLATGTAAAEAVFPPGSRVGLEPPPGMSLSTSFQGFENRASGASIVALDLPGEAHAEILPGFSGEGMRASGLRASGPAVDWPVRGGEGRLLRGTQAAHGLVFRKWVVLAKAAGATAMVTVQVPEDTRGVPSDAAIEAALRTIALRAPQSIEEQIAALPFRIADHAGFRVVRALAGSGLVLTEGPADVSRNASQPLVVVASSLSGGPAPADRSAFARRAYATIAGVDDLAVASDDSEERDGASWSVIDGHGTDRGSGTPVQTAQITRFTADGYVRVIGIWRRSEAASLAERFGRLGRSVTAK